MKRRLPYLRIMQCGNRVGRSDKRHKLLGDVSSEHVHSKENAC